MIGTLVDEAEVALQLAMIGGEDHIGVGVPSALGDAFEHATARLIDEFVLDVNHRVDFAHLIMGQLTRNE